MVDNNDRLLREVEAELQRDKWNKIWEQYGTYLVAGVAAVVLGVGGFQLYETSRRDAARTAGAQYETAVKLAVENKVDDATKSLDTIIQNGPAGYAALARLQHAGLLLKQQKRAEALTVFEALGKDSNADPIFRDYAQLQAAALRSGEADWTEMQNRLTALMADDNPWRHSARELLGVSAFKAGKLDEARKLTEPLLGTSGVPSEMVERASNLLGLIVEAEQAVANPVPVEAPAPAAPVPPGLSIAPPDPSKGGSGTSAPPKEAAPAATPAPAATETKP